MATLKAAKRDQIGTRKATHLRKEGKIPAVLYGHGQPTETISLEGHDVELAILHGERVLDLALDGKEQTVMFKDVQYDTFGQDILHVDLARVNLDERVEVAVAVTLVGTPAGAKDGGVLEQPYSEINIEVPVRSIPEEIRVQVNELELWDRIQLGQIELPQGATLLDDPDEVLCSCIEVQEELPEEGEEEVDMLAEPEVIGESADEEGDDDADKPEEG